MARIESQHEHAMASQQEEYNAERQRWQFFYVACPISSILLNMFPVLPTALRHHPSSSQDERGAEISRLRLAAVSRELSTADNVHKQEAAAFKEEAIVENVYV